MAKTVPVKEDWLKIANMLLADIKAEKSTLEVDDVVWLLRKVCPELVTTEPKK